MLSTIPLAFTLNAWAAITSDGVTAFAATGTSIDYFDAASGAMTNSVSLPNATNASIFLAISPDNTTLYTLYGNGAANLCAITVASASIRACQPVGASYNMQIFTRALAVSADGTRVYAFSSPYDLGVFDGNSLALLNTFTVTAQQSLRLQALDAAVTPDGSAVYWAAHGYPNGVYDGSTLAQIATVSPGPTRSVVIGPQ